MDNSLYGADDTRADDPRYEARRALSELSVYRHPLASFCSRCLSADRKITAGSVSSTLMISPTCSLRPGSPPRRPRSSGTRRRVGNVRQRRIQPHVGTAITTMTPLPWLTSRLPRALWLVWRSVYDGPHEYPEAQARPDKKDAALWPGSPTQGPVTATRRRRLCDNERREHTDEGNPQPRSDVMRQRLIHRLRPLYHCAHAAP